MGLGRAYAVNNLKKSLVSWREGSGQFIQRDAIDVAELSSVPKTFGRTIGGCGSKRCEGPPLSCGHRLLLSREQGAESWQLLLRNPRAMLKASVGLPC